MNGNGSNKAHGTTKTTMNGPNENDKNDKLNGQMAMGGRSAGATEVKTPTASQTVVIT